jgi:uncharacterized protein
MRTDPLNRLRDEKSPYLLQHAANPVDWYPWGEEAFALASREDKPVFLSIGYSTCHWCHVMAHESFEDNQVAALLNEAFVCIKVDREERPDIDALYMRICQMMTGGGGWPLTVIMTPDRRPFYTATYIPKEGRWGRQGLVELIPRIGEVWQKRRGEVEDAATRMVLALRQSRPPAGELPVEEVLNRAFAEMKEAYDDLHGGFGDAPKFPMPHQLIFLLRHGRRTGALEALGMVQKTLAAMRQGGLFDQLGHGFHRYSTDRQWLVPHFEKMLYDQALMALACAEAFQATGDETHARTLREILDYLLTDLRAPEGGFYAAEDADSEGEEGRFYLWRMDEIRRLLSPEDARLAAEAFGLAEEGNFTDPAAGGPTAGNILHLAGPPEIIAGRLGIGEADFRRHLEEVRRALLVAREKRVRPGRDDKILTDWNGLAVAALARAARVLDEPRYLEAARAALLFLLDRLRTADGRLLHRFCKGEAALAANLDDYAFVIWGLIECYEAGFAAEDLEEALALQGILDERFLDADGAYFSTPDDGEVLLARLKEGHDGAVPSGNAVTLMNLIRLGRMIGDPGPEERAAALGRAFAVSLRQLPSAHAQWMIALELLAAPSCDVVIAGRPGAEDTGKLLDVLRRRYLPSLTLLVRPEGETNPRIAALTPFVRQMRAVEGRAAAYVCAGFSCRRPVTDPQELAELLDAPVSP